MTMYLVLLAFTSSPISLLATAKASACGSDVTKMGGKAEET